jgi:hypothetical protein
MSNIAERTRKEQQIRQTRTLPKAKVTVHDQGLQPAIKHPDDGGNRITLIVFTQETGDGK